MDIATTVVAGSSLAISALKNLSKTQASAAITIINRTEKEVNFFHHVNNKGRVLDGPRPLRSMETQVIKVEGLLGQLTDGIDVLFFAATTDDLRNNSISNFLVLKLFIPAKITKTSPSKTNRIAVGAGERVLGMKPSDDDKFTELSPAFTQLMKSETSDQDDTIGPYKVKTKSVNLTPTSKKQIMVKSRFCDVTFDGTEAHSQGCYSVVLDSPGPDTSASTSSKKRGPQGLPKEDLELAHEALYGLRPYLRLEDLGTKKAHDVNIFASVDQIKRFKQMKVKEMDENYASVKKTVNK